MGFTNGVTFDLDVSGIAGFFGGDESIAAMASVNLIRYRWLLGWYNSPGSYAVSKKYGIIASQRIWDGLFPGEDSTPAEALGLDGKHGPRFIGAKSGTAIEMTGHLSSLLFDHLKGSPSSPHATHESVSKYTSPRSSTLLPAATTAHPEAQYLNTLTFVQMDKQSGHMPPVGGDNVVMDNFIKQLGIGGGCAAFLTTGFSIAAAVIVAVLWNDNFCCLAIGIGIICNGLAAVIYGSATLKVIVPPVAADAVPGDGILIRGNDVVILQGPESKVASIIRGKYELTYPGGPPYHRIGFVSMLLTVQAFSQIVLLPVATLNGQILFLGTFALSWLYNAYLASVDRDKLQFSALRKVLGLGKVSSFEKRSFQKWASVVAASTFILHPIRPDAWISKLIPNSTPVWDKWRECLVLAVEAEHGGSEKAPMFDMPTHGLEDWTDKDKAQLKAQLDSAKIGYEWYLNQREPIDGIPDRKYD
ncbi:hypothetical protein BDN70DRAFT_847448 [Pholiota conissans]|uniref:Uncharacterized protein n=1 Tax=Pholiota conissans TaxID=109636 RepID=A0A9P5ZDA9_9AGAR|nr:hypothetical protein BDN70DRAFT_847448 [Pholiota conissans]